MKVAYWQGGDSVVILPHADGPADSVLWVQGDGGTIVCGHDHYWFNDDGSIGHADHHDYDEPGWPVVGCRLPQDRPAFNGILLPDETWKKVRPW
jgi:hypothetical protein